MAAIQGPPGIKYDDGLPGYSANCFPVRSLIGQTTIDDSDGAWLIAHRAEQRRRFKAILCTKPKTYARIKEERKRAERQGTTILEQNVEGEEDEEEEKDVPLLDGFFLMRHCCVEDPSDLCSVNISGKEMTDVKEEDLSLFDNVAYVNASENFLPFEAFRGFPILRELEMPLNALRSIKPKIGDYPALEVLDVSYNNLSQEDILTIGLLGNLKVLHLTGNNLRLLPNNMAMPYFDEQNKTEILRFAKLEILLLDDNKLEDVSVFASLAGLSSLKHLNLEKNELYYVPMLKSVEGQVVPNSDEKEVRKLRRSAEKGGRKSPRNSRSKDPTPRQPSLQKKEKEDSTEAPKPTPVPEAAEPKLGNGESNGNVNKVDDLLEGLLNEDLGDISRQITDIELEKEVTLDTLLTKDNDDDLDDGSSLPPFPDLRVLNLAYNKVEDEEALLAVAAWPMLVELIIHNNPLTTENSGDPPLLQRFLGERLGIKLKRKKEPEVVKPPVEVKLRKTRHVTSVVPKIPKLSVDDLLMLEAPKPPPAITHTPKPQNMDTKSPLPPIPQSPNSLRSRSMPEGQGQTRERSQHEVEKETLEEDQPDQTTHPDGDAFFMTQVDEQVEETTTGKEQKSIKKQKKNEKGEKKTNIYKGFEVLLDCDEDPNYASPKDMQGSIKALKYALGHELIYRDPKARLDRISKPVEPYRKAELPKSTPRDTQAMKKERILEETKARITSEEAILGDVLVGSKNLQRRFPESERLLSEIQRRYNAVRVNSMKEAKDARKMLAGTLNDVTKTKDTSKRVKIET